MYKRFQNDYGQWLWPIQDTQCCAAVFGEIPKLQHVVESIKTRNIVVQAGGNCGAFARVLAPLFRAVYTFEPDRTNFSCLISNVPEENVWKFPAALGETNVCISMGNGPTEDETNCGAFQVDGPGLVPTLTIDQLALPACDLIYLDIEGAELPALKGAQATISMFHPVIVTEEKGLGRKFGSQEEDIRVFLKKFGYKVETSIANDVIYRC
jgi:FkbM family methyltransferase